MLTSITGSEKQLYSFQTKQTLEQGALAGMKRSIKLMERVSPPRKHSSPNVHTPNTSITLHGAKSSGQKVREDLEVLTWCSTSRLHLVNSCGQSHHLPKSSGNIRLDGHLLVPKTYSTIVLKG
jgi:hypothetical protein